MREKYHRKIDKKAFFYPEDYMKMLECSNKKEEFNLKVMINTGARINEARHIERKDLDTERETIVLRITKVRAKLGEKFPDPRIIPVGSKFFKYMRLNIKKFKVYSTNNYRLILQKLAKEVKVKNWKDFSSHNMRKTFGSWMLALGVDGFKLAQHLGHSAEMLRRSYASPDIFNVNDKGIMGEVLGNLPNKLRGT